MSVRILAAICRAGDLSLAQEKEMKKDHKLFFAIPFDAATKNLYAHICDRIRREYPAITTVIGNQEVGPSPEYSDFASFKAQNRELSKQFVAQIMALFIARSRYFR